MKIELKDTAFPDKSVLVFEPELAVDRLLLEMLSERAKATQSEYFCWDDMEGRTGISFFVRANRT